MDAPCSSLIDLNSCRILFGLACVEIRRSSLLARFDGLSFSAASTGSGVLLIEDLLGKACVIKEGERSASRMEAARWVEAAFVEAGFDIERIDF